MTERNRGEAKLREAYGEIARLKEELERERDYLREEVQVSMNFGRIIGESPALGGDACAHRSSCRYAGKRFDYR